ncbi:MAG: hypothetical protein LBU17_13035 [Treponema sp.]|nr:hypothetical protein [Treponema sp.]
MQFINALFDTNYPITSIVQYPNTETLNRKRQKRIADILIRIVALDGEHNYLIEAQTKDDPGLVVRIFGLFRLSCGKQGKRGKIDRWIPKSYTRRFWG